MQSGGGLRGIKTFSRDRRSSLIREKSASLDSEQAFVEKANSPKKFPRIQVLTAAEILDNRMPQIPFGFAEGFKKAEREESSEQGKLI
jgi:hypothetical protein